MREMSHDRQYAPATVRNRDFILDVLRDVLPTRGVILEVACGSGEHVVHFARNLPSLVFQPSDPDPDARLSVAAWVKATGVTNLRAPIALDALHSVLPIASADGIICINMIHLALGGDCGIDQRRGRHTSFEIAAVSIWVHTNAKGSKRRRAIKPSTRAFAIDQNWGLRDLEAVAAMAQSVGFSAPVITEVPANNLSVVFRRM
jgi:Protein of unknown function (DUF938)